MKKEPVFRGVCTALITPMRGDAIDFECMEALIERQIAAGVDALAVCGTTGEAPTLSPAEHRRLIRFTVEAVRGRLPVIAGTGSNDTRHAIETSIYAASAGADALLTVTPYYNKTTPEGLVRSFTAIADATPLPVILYNVPTRTCVDIPPEVYARLCRHGRIVAAKEASPSMEKSVYTRHLCGDALTLYSGNDDLTLPMLAIGAQGVISVLSNLLPQEMCAMWHAWEAGDTAAAGEKQCELSPIMRAMFCEVNPTPLKYAMSTLGLCSPDVRLPLVPPTEENKATLRELTAAFAR